MKTESSYGDATLKIKKELLAVLGIINYLGKFSPSMADIYELLRKLMSLKTEWDPECNMSEDI